jgi:serine/threonine protein kinase
LPARLIACLADRFANISPLGGGAFCRVYRARDKDSGLEVAVKYQPAGDQAAIARLMGEATVLRRLRGPGVPKIFAGGLLGDDGAYVAMELIHGHTLDVLLSDGALPVRAVISLGHRISDILRRLHCANAVHRDIKPANVIVPTRSGRPDYCSSYLVDFNLAADFVGAASAYARTPVGEHCGTLQYMAPEQMLGRPCDHRADIYACGIVLFEATFGYIPMSDVSVELMAAEGVAIRPIKGGAFLLRRVREDILVPHCAPCPGMAALLAAMLQRDPRNRVRTASDVLRWLESLSVSAETG